MERVMKKAYFLFLIICFVLSASCGNNDKIEDAEKAELKAYNTAKAGTYDDCVIFLSKYPKSKYASEISELKVQKTPVKKAPKRTSPELTAGEMQLLTEDLLGKVGGKTDIKRIIIYPMTKFDVPPNWVGTELKKKREVYIGSLANQIDTLFQRFVINKAGCTIPQDSNHELKAVMNQLSKLLDENYNQEDAVEKLGQLAVADAFIFVSIIAVSEDKKNDPTMPFHVGLKHQVETKYSIDAKLVTVGKAEAVWIGNPVKFVCNTEVSIE